VLGDELIERRRGRGFVVFDDGASGAGVRRDRRVAWVRERGVGEIGEAGRSSER
jgi:hypothetical protein